ncbi:hypothetical protein B0J11DRAFT_438764 [Dendryphion nanum]|uniref:ABM domain-containing protein n=1 Tax=Dendryphion nanum TaxID=256645 RepID=A0A9P9DHS2_9PLEO|nr:hypothetical protein B0J11DRAFT_438764 [Dendryphion nanum]
MPIDIIAIITPKPGKAERVEALLKTTATAVNQHEPGVLRYHLQRETKVKEGQAPTFVMLETYKDEQSLGIHAGTEHFKELSKAFKGEDLLAEPMKVLFTEAVGGFVSRL